jgi:hypothetical protein
MNILLLLMNVLRKRRLPVPFLLIEWAVHTISMLCSIFFLSHSCYLGLLSFARDASYHCQALCSLHPCSSCSMLSNLILYILPHNLFLYILARDVCHCQILFLHSCSWPASTSWCLYSILLLFSHSCSSCSMLSNLILYVLAHNLLLYILAQCLMFCAHDAYH